MCLVFSSRKSLIGNVIHVPRIRKNLVYGGISYKYRYKQVYESDKYILSKCGAFVEFLYIWGK